MEDIVVLLAATLPGVVVPTGAAWHTIDLANSIGKLLVVGEIMERWSFDIESVTGQAEELGQDVAESRAHFSQLLDLLDEPALDLRLPV